ncbi:MULTISPECIES: ATP-binding protein [unclassified Bradyrhizobium]|uniref:ATP-binding protein n=1 Tax=unclassified Bradyrhizobium TaxID=2631580 RepID=UPI001FFB3D9E|nr:MULTISPECIES: ATP-binding protein [unclassified Bradyrhizobium]MCK1710154.1 GAF domain-containing protein [Bradyrhizobium sp. 143]MCK1725643.1 GAF domain-containing protein [Bradyrhizobium sp. 142]
MRLENETSELELIAKAIQAISKETGYEGLAKALLNATLGYCGAARGAVLLSDRGELLDKADASFSRERARFFASQPPAGDFRLPPNLTERVLIRQETVISEDSWDGLALIDTAKYGPGRKMTQLCLPLIHQERTIGVLYLESERKETFAPRYVSVISMLASQAAVSFESAQLFEALRETNMWMIKGQQIGRMGSYRWNTRTLLSRASRECYRIFDINLDVNPVPFEAFKDRIHPDDFPGLEQALVEAVSTKSPFSHEYRVVHRDGTTLRVIAEGEFDLGPTGDVELEGIIADITARTAAEQSLTDARSELARAVRLASLGELAGSIVHEINQPLTGIIASAEACLRWLARDPAQPDEARKSATRVIEQGRQASDVVAGLRSLVRDEQLRFTDVQINDAIEEILVLLKSDFERAGVALKTTLDRSIPTIAGDRVQLQQVVLNLVRNAIEAMAGINGRPRVLSSSSKVADDHVAVMIADTGIGIAPTNRERIFDALYTTKGDGLGIGLSICRKIVAVHGGRLWVEQSTAHGATFTFTLPLRQSIQMSGSH